MREIFFVKEDAEEKPVSEIGGNNVEDDGVDDVQGGLLIDCLFAGCAVLGPNVGWKITHRKCYAKG